MTFCTDTLGDTGALAAIASAMAVGCYGLAALIRALAPLIRALRRRR